jgi:hypothetical protein
LKVFEMDFISGTGQTILNQSKQFCKIKQQSERLLSSAARSHFHSAQAPSRNSTRSRLCCLSWRFHRRTSFCYLNKPIKTLYRFRYSVFSTEDCPSIGYEKEKHCTKHSRLTALVRLLDSF